MIVAPGQYLLAVSKDDLKILKAALADWEGSCPTPEGLDTRTPIQKEYHDRDVARAREMSGEIGKFLRK